MEDVSNTDGEKVYKGSETNILFRNLGMWKNIFLSHCHQKLNIKTEIRAYVF